MYRLQPGRTIAQEIKRIADKQLMLALLGLRRVGTPDGDAAVDEACRHITKVGALLRLIRLALGDDSYISANRRLAVIRRRLSPVADGRAALGALARVAVERDLFDGVVSLQSIREALVARAARVDRKAAFDRVVPRSIEMLAVERARVGTWVLDARGIRAIAPGLADSVRHTREAMARAIERPTAARYDAWRRRTKDLCLQVHLVEGRCTGLRAVRIRLAALDDCLDDAHNVALLEWMLTTDLLESRHDTATMLRLLRHDQAALRVRARTLGRAALRQTPRQFVRHVANHWRAHRVPGRSGSRPPRVRHAA